MKGAPVVLVFLLAFLLLSACLQPRQDLNAPPLAPTSASFPSHVLAGAVEPVGLEPSSFRLLDPVAQTAAVGGGGEPSIWAHLDGTLYLTFPGCEVGGLANPLTARSCANGPLYRSTDGGTSWKRLNQAETGALAQDGPRANGDADIAVDAAGVLYATDLGSGVQLFRSYDHGDSWSYVGNLTPPQAWADRQWIAAADPGRLVVAWMGGKTSDQRAVAVRTSWDYGRNWTDLQYLGENIGWLGPVQFDPSGKHAYVPFTISDGDVGVPNSYGTHRFHLALARSLDGGVMWDVVDTGVIVMTTITGGHWSGVLMAPAFDVTGDGHLVYAWAEDVPDPTGLTSTGARVQYIASANDGQTWTTPRTASTTTPTAIMPWVTGGAGDRAAITYFSSSVPLDSDTAGVWDVSATVIDGVTTDPHLVTSTVAPMVHLGGLCSRGGSCRLPPPSDRTLLDFFESDLLPDGRLVVAYPTDPLDGGKTTVIRVALQNGGTPLLARL